jgi:hypothetical protein
MLSKVTSWKGKAANVIGFKVKAAKAEPGIFLMLVIPFYALSILMGRHCIPQHVLLKIPLHVLLKHVCNVLDNLDHVLVIDVYNHLVPDLEKENIRN